METNEDLRKDVMDEIKWDPQLKDVCTQILVSEKDGIITLSGLVDTYGKKMAAERAAQRIQGVKIVACDIEVDPDRKKTDAAIAEAVENALHWNSAVNNDQIKIIIDDGWIYLDGTVDWDYERIFAQRCVENLIGVKGVTNNISIKLKTIDSQEIKSKIVEAFQRSANIDSSSVKIESVGSKVTLHGKVRSWAEKKEAEQVAWASPGVMSVDNQIEIDVQLVHKL
jgi:osmotically-inducible protein OsmY